MRLTSVPNRVRSGAARSARAGASLSRRLAGGLSVGFVAALAALVLVAILFTVASREPKEAKGYAELTLFPKGCLVDSTRELHVRGCSFVAPGLYRVGFEKSLRGTTPVVSRGSCCPGRIRASVVADRAVMVVVERRLRRPIRVSVFTP
jgi:hypothetical protein